MGHPGIHLLVDNLRFGLRLHFLARNAGGQFNQLESAGRNVHDAKIGNDAADHPRARQRQRALEKNFWLAAL